MLSKSSFLIKIDYRGYLIMAVLFYLLMGFWGFTFFLIGYLHQLIVISLISLKPGIICWGSNYELIYAQRGSFIIKKNVSLNNS